MTLDTSMDAWRELVGDADSVPVCGLPASYANFAMITHSALREMIIDIGQVLPGSTEVHWLIRLAWTVDSAKTFANALNENIARYEKGK